jgi:putative flippase GtrA
MKELYHKTYTKGRTLAKSQQQLIVYGIIGLSGATLDFLAYLFLYKQLGVAPPLASFLSVSLGITNNFIWNSRFNFKVSDKLLQRFLNFYTIGLIGAVTSAILIAAFQKAGIDPTIAKLLTIPPIVLGQYFLNKKLSFKK